MCVTDLNFDDESGGIGKKMQWSVINDDDRSITLRLISISIQKSIISLPRSMACPFHKTRLVNTLTWQGNTRNLERIHPFHLKSLKIFGELRNLIIVVS